MDKYIFQYLQISFLAIIIFTSCGKKKAKTKNASNSVNGIVLENKYKKGESYIITTTWQEIISSTDPLGMQRKDTIKMENTMHFYVNDVDEKGTANVTGKYESMKMGQFNSSDSSTYGTLEGKMFRRMKNSVLKMKIDKTGAVLELTGANEIYSIGLPDSLIDDDKIMKENINNTLAIFPGKVKVGDRWTRSNEITFGYPCKYLNNYQLKEIKNGMALIELTSDLRPFNNPPYTFFPGGIQLKQTLSGNQKGTIEIDVARGKITRSAYNLIISGTAKGTVQGKEMNMQINTDLRITNLVEFGEKEK